MINHNSKNFYWGPNGWIEEKMILKIEVNQFWDHFRILGLSLSRSQEQTRRCMTCIYLHFTKTLDLGHVDGNRDGVQEEENVQKSRFIETNGTFSHFRFFQILTQGTKWKVFFLGIYLQLGSFWLKPRWENWILYFQRKISKNIREFFTSWTLWFFLKVGFTPQYVPAENLSNVYYFLTAKRFRKTKKTDTNELIVLRIVFRSKFWTEIKVFFSLEKRVFPRC